MQSLEVKEDNQEQNKYQKFHLVSKYLLKEVLMTFVIFNMFNLSFSAGLQMRYINEVDSWAILCMLFAFTTVIAVIIAQFITD